MIVDLPTMPDRLCGWNSLAVWLKRIEAPNASGKRQQLQQRALRHGLPVRRIGDRVYWEQTDLHVWVEHWCGIPFDAWLDELARRGRLRKAKTLRGGGIDMTGVPRDARGAWPAYAAIQRAGEGWELVRTERAQVLMARTRKRVVRWPDDALLPGAQVLYYERTRTATPDDLTAVRPGSRDLVGAFRWSHGAYQWLRVPAERFGTYPKARPTACATLMCDARLPDLYREARTRYPSCFWVVWTRPIQLDIETLRANA